MMERERERFINANLIRRLVGKVKPLPAAFVCVGAGAHASTHTKAVQPFSIINMKEGNKKKKENKKDTT